MRRDEFLQRKRELEERLRAGIELLEAAHRAEVRALETLWVSYGEAESPEEMAAPPVPEATAPPVAPARRSKVRREAGTLYEESWRRWIRCRRSSTRTTSAARSGTSLTAPPCTAFFRS